MLSILRLIESLRVWKRTYPRFFLLCPRVAIFWHRSREAVKHLVRKGDFLTSLEISYPVILEERFGARDDIYIYMLDMAPSQ